MTYEELLIEADKAGLTVREKPLRESDGRINGRRIAIRKNIQTSVGKACVMAEELGHWHTSAENIPDQDEVENRKQEHRARLWAYDHMIGLEGIVSAAKAGCRNAYEIADHLGVTEEFLQESLNTYRGKYGQYAVINTCLISFEPSLYVYRATPVLDFPQNSSGQPELDAG
ncbi:MAG: ImmA/IrrE family metallo-endopeptidase [Lachnospiraceae bacterium]|nr:ImmA/IrrE family metallo-endopeptidase [Lachnospiraceae bacterium]